MDLWLPVLLSTVAATAFGVVRSIRVRRYTINVDVYQAVLQRLLRQRQFERMKKLAVAAKPAIFANAVDQADQALVDRLPKTPEPLARASAEEAFKRTHAAELARFRAAPFADLVVIALGPGAAFFGYVHAAAHQGRANALAAFSLLLTLDGLRQRKKLRDADAAQASELLDLLTQARLESDDPYRSRPRELPPLEKPAPPGLWLRVLKNGAEVDRVTLSDRVLKIGRVASAHVFLDDPGVARLHAVLEVNDDELDIIDLGSNQGTFVDGEKVAKARLVRGSRVEIGPFELVVERGAAALALGSPKAKPEPKVNLERTCNACGSTGFVPLTDAPPSVVPEGYRAETCKNCGKVELFKTEHA